LLGTCGSSFESCKNIIPYSADRTTSIFVITRTSTKVLPDEAGKARAYTLACRLERHYALCIEDDSAADSQAGSFWLAADDRLQNFRSLSPVVLSHMYDSRFFDLMHLSYVAVQPLVLRWAQQE
jgi:hypothetical protein